MVQLLEQEIQLAEALRRVVRSSVKGGICLVGSTVPLHAVLRHYERVS